ncbi:MAG: hypothetical protein H7296_09355 [Bacteroidia bacterium]|nr:hypothetical protein [Bacteroidia bacterium]
MNEIFNLKRFLQLLRKTIFEKPIQMFGLSFLVFALSLIIYTCFRSISNYQSANIISFFIGLVLGGFFLAAAVMGNFSNTANGISFLTLPVSAFEKWLTAVIIICVLYLPLYLLFFRIMDLTMIQIYHHGLDPNKADYKELYDKARILEYTGLEAKIFFIFFFNVTGAMLAGSLYFNKISVIKVALICVAVFFGFYSLNYLIAGIFFDSLEAAFPFSGVSIELANQKGRIDLPPQASGIVLIMFQYIFPALLYVLAFVKLREKEF